VVVTLIRKNEQRTFTNKDLVEIQQLEAKCTNLLLDREKDWQMKSRETWIEVGDENTFLFSKLCKQPKEQQHLIWELENDEGVKVRGFRDLHMLVFNI
jgi:hypothetical protein